MGYFQYDVCKTLYSVLENARELACQYVQILIF